jgi:alpha-glucosidase (family GH31 glycosyl hydrolase)
MRHHRVASPVFTLLLLGCAALTACSDDDKPPPADSGPDAALIDAASDGTSKPDAMVCSYKPSGDEAIPIPPIHTPRWAFAPWISKDISDGPDTYAFVDGFKSRDIPVGAVVLDSPWETNYNTFVPNPKRYPNFGKMISDLHAQNVKVVLWITQTVNAASFDLETGGDTYDGPSPNYAEGQACGFYVNDGMKYTWWKGFGSGLDFFNPLARQWWHAQQDAVLALGVDGWKLDFGEEYIGLKDVLTHQGKKPLQDYSEKYYEDFWAYGVHKRGKEFVTMVRGYDKSYQWPGRFFARPEHAPVIWAGDNRRDWIGLADALDHMFRSAAKGYVVVGSDIGGYLDLDDVDPTISVPFDQDNFVRWVAVGALSPFMQLHGRGNLTPWTVTPKTQETIAIYRYWSWLHQQLVPFFYSLAESAYRDQAPPILRPIGAEASWPGDYRYTLGEAFLVAPLLDGTGKRDVVLPAGARYYDWWKPAADAIAGGQTLKAYDATDQQRIPLFVREGAIIPMDVENELTGTGSKASKGALTVLVYPGANKSSFALRDDDELVSQIDAEGIAPGSTTVTLARVRKTTILRVRTDSPATTVQLGGQAQSKLADRAAFDAAQSGWWYDASLRATWIKLAKQSGSATVTLGY